MEKTSECLELRFFSYLNVIFLGLFQTKGRVKLTKKNEKKCNNYQTVLQTLDILFTIAFFPWISFSV